METTVVKITDCDITTCWYFGLEGEIFEVYDNRRDYILKEDYDLGHNAAWRHIQKGDCEIVTTAVGTGG